MVNPWIVHVKNTRKLMPKGTLLKQVLKMAKKTYKKKNKTIIKKHKKRSHKRSNKRSHKKRRGGNGDGSTGSNADEIPEN
jgi:hypothetical protein